jgi:flavin reductase (DIM6/NTAB) family NADH-FMN oxidoreductase RutF
LSYGFYIVTSQDNDRSNGQIINTSIQVTSEPTRLAVIINKKKFDPRIDHQKIARQN